MSRAGTAFAELPSVKDKPVIHPVLMQSIPDGLKGEDRDQAIAGAGAIETTVQAIQFINQRAGQACVDPDNLFLIGSSAGGVTASTPPSRSMRQ